MPRLNDNNILLMVTESPLRMYNYVIWRLYQGPTEKQKDIIENYIVDCDGELFDEYWRLGATNCDKTGYGLVTILDEKTPAHNHNSFILKKFILKKFNIKRTTLVLLQSSLSLRNDVKFHYLPLKGGK